MSIADKLLTIANNTPKVCENLYPKKMVSGNSVAIGDVSPIEHNLSVRLKSKNLFDISKIPSNSKGTIINNGDGTIYVKGSAISTNRTLAQCCPLLRVGDVATISLRITNALEDTTKYTYIYLYEIKKTWTTDQVFTITQEMLDSKVFLYCRVYGTNIESTPDGILSQIQVELGSTATAYTPYRTDFSGVNVSRLGKNLFDVSKFKSTANGNYTNNGDGTITIVSYGVGSDTTLKRVCPHLKSGDKAVISFNTSSDKKFIYLSPAKFTWNVGKTVKITEDMLNSNIIFYCQRTDGINYPAIISNIQVEIGTFTTDFENYKQAQIATANSDGTVDGLTSLLPNMTLISDTGDAIIECTYRSNDNPTANKKFIELQNAFASVKEILKK